MVTSFMDIPDNKPTSQDDGKEDNEATVVGGSSVGYSNHGTFQTPDRGGPSGTLSPNNLMQEIAEENDDYTPESEEIGAKAKRAVARHER